MVEIPLNSFAQPGFEIFRRLPTELRAYLVRVERITPIVTGAIRDEFDQAVMRGARRIQFIEQQADRAHHFNVRSFRVPADIVSLAGAPLAPSLPGRIGLEIRSVVQGGLRILEKIERVDYDVFRHRPVLGALDWPLLLWRALRMALLASLAVAIVVTPALCAAFLKPTHNERPNWIYRTFNTYYGKQPMHVVFERSTWHSAQHGRQLVHVLERYGIKPNQPLTADDLAGLPLPERLFE